MNAIATALKNRIGTITVGGLSAGLYFGTAPRNTDYPHVTFMPTSDVPIRLQNEDPLSVTHWDFKIWGTKAIDVGKIYSELISIFNADDLDDNSVIVSLRGRGLPLVSEENRPDDIIYSRVIECEILTN